MADTSSPRSLRVFLCHSSADKPAVRELYQRLRVDGIDAWLDEENLLPGQNWQREIPRAVRQADVVIVCLSQRSINKAGYVQKELKFALDVADEQPEGAIYIIPLKLERCEVPERLSHWQWVDLFDVKGYDRLMRALHARAEGLGLVIVPAPLSESLHPGVKVTASSAALNSHFRPGPASEGRLAVVLPLRKELLTDVQLWAGVEFVLIPTGQFLMGSRADDQAAADNEKPQHTIEIPYDYWIARYPVTNDQFAAFIEASRYRTTAEKEGGWSTQLGRFLKNIDWRHPLEPASSLAGKADHPVVQVSWYDAWEYCKWRNSLAETDLFGDRRVRLPTEAEWEKAARGEKGNAWPWGKEFDRDSCNTIEGGPGETTPVGSYSPWGDSPYGVSDMAGNVWEWTMSLWGKNLGQPDYGYPYDSTDGRERCDAPDTFYRGLRGGAFSSNQGLARPASRVRDAPRNRNINVGFRVVIAPPLA